MGRPVRTGVLLLALAGAAVLAMLGPVPAAYAHTELVHRELVGGTPDRPKDLLLRFSEPIDAKFLTVDIAGPGGESQAPVTIDAQHRTDGLVDVSRLAQGVYSIAWWTRALDGDPSNGSFILGIGTAVDPVALLPPIGARDPATQPAMFYGDTAWDTIIHWLIYLGAVLMVGSLGFSVVVWHPMVRKRATRAAVGVRDARLARMLRSLALAGGALFLFANLLLFVMQLEFIRYAILQPLPAVAPTPLAPSTLSHAAPYQTAADIFRGYNGAVWITRIVLSLAALALTFRLTAPATRQPWRWRAALAIGLGMLATMSLTAHAAVVPQSRYAVVIDWTHLTAMSLWLGGLLPLILVLREFRRQEAAGPAGADEDLGLRMGVVRRFSTLALLAVIWLAATGLFAAYIHVRNPSLLVPTTYGRALILKLVLFAVLFALGAVHRRVSIPRLDGSAKERRSALERLLPFEAGIGASLLAVVALLMSLGTSAAVWPAHQALGLVATSATGQVTVTLRAVTGKAGDNAVALDVADRRSGLPTTAGRVTLEVGGQSYVLSPAGPLATGTVQRFVSKDMVRLPEGKYMATYAISRPSYADVGGGVTLDVPPALSPASPEK
jgi:copper transport protein